MSHTFFVICAIALVVWLFRQLPGFGRPLEPIVTFVLFLVAAFLLAWLLAGSPPLLGHG